MVVNQFIAVRCCASVMAGIMDNGDITISFEDMKSEFIAMDKEIKEKAEEIQRLQQTLINTENRYSLQANETNKNVDEMEELHENLAELDGRFERSEKLNHQLREEIDIIKFELQIKDDKLKKTICDAEKNLKESNEDYKRLENEFNDLKIEANKKYEFLRNSLKESIESTYQNICDYLGKKRNKKLSRKGKSYSMLKSAESELLLALSSFKDYI